MNAPYSEVHYLFVAIVMAFFFTILASNSVVPNLWAPASTSLWPVRR